MKGSDFVPGVKVRRFRGGLQITFCCGAQGCPQLVLAKNGKHVIRETNPKKRELGVVQFTPKRLRALRKQLNKLNLG